MNEASTQNCYFPYPGQYPNQYPNQYPSHITHSWGLGMGDPFGALAKAMERLAAAIEKHNELAGKVS